MKGLNGLHVVVTRPPAQGRRWQQQLEAAGATVTAIPVLAIVAIADAAAERRIKEQILALADYHKAIFVSQNAVEHAFYWIDNYWPQLPVSPQYFAIGAATAAALASHGMAAQAAAAAMNSETLLSLPDLQQVAGQKIIIFRGRGGRPLLAEQLQQRGAKVSLCELYERLLPATAQERWQAWLGKGALNAVSANAKPAYVISAHSGEGLENLSRVLHNVAGSAEVFKWPLLVPGERVAVLARQLGFARVITALNATDDAMTAALQDWYASLSNGC